jgi:hypothetical protein
VAWQIHIANCSGVLTEFLPEIGTALANAERRMAALTGPFELDIVVQNMPGRVIPQLGFVGHAPTGNLVHLTFDGSNENLKSNVGLPLERMVAHEINHVWRWRGPGYGATLGEVLISEGLAGHISRQIYGNLPEPWEEPEDDDTDALEEATAGWGEPYNHMEWFFGSGKYPHWLGYRLGYRIVGRHIEMSKRSAWELTGVSADEFRAATRSLAT